MGSTISFLIPLAGVLALAYTFWKMAWVGQQDPGTERMQRIGRNIADGAMAFLKAEYKVLAAVRAGWLPRCWPFQPIPTPPA